MRDETRVVLNALLSYGSRAAVGVVGILMVPYLLGRLGEASYGMIGLAGSLTSLAVLVELGLRPAASRQFTRFLFSGETTRANELASTATAIYAAMAVAIVSVVALGGAASLRVMGVSSELQPEAFAALVIAAASVAIRLMQAPYEAALASQLRYDVIQYMEAVGAVLRALFIVATFTLLGPSLTLWALALVISAGLAYFVHRDRARAYCETLLIRRKLVSRRGFSDLAGFGALTSLFQLASWLTVQSAPLIISYFHGPERVAYYLPAMILVVSLQPLSRAFLYQLTPVVTRAQADGELERIQRILVRSTRYTLLLSGGAVALLASVSFRLMPTWLGPEFDVTAWVLIALCAQAFLHACVGGAFPIFVGTGRIRGMSLLNAGLALGSVSASVYMVGWTSLGVIGPAIAIAGEQVIRTAVWFWYATRICQVDRLSYLRSAFLGPGVCLLALVATSLLTQELLDLDAWLELAAAAAASAVVFVPLGWTIGLSRDDRVRALSYARLGSGWIGTLAQRLGRN